MANWANPLLTSTYVNFVTEVKGRDDDAAKQFDPATTSATNVPTGTIRWNSSANLWQKWNGTAWAALTTSYAISITGNAATVTNGVVTTGSYADPSWITSLNYSKLIGTVPTWNQNTTGSAATLTTARTLTVGNTGKTFNGSANVTWTLTEIGAVPSTGVTGAANVPSGTTAQRPTAATGQFRFNTTLGKFEGYNGAAWGAVGGGATGGGNDDVFVENGQLVTTDYTISSGKNAMSAGPITISSGVVVTVPSGSNWAIV